MPDAAMSTGGWVLWRSLQHYHSSMNVLWFTSDCCWNSNNLQMAKTLRFWW
jgi:hypothetical protein